MKLSLPFRRWFSALGLVFVACGSIHGAPDPDAVLLDEMKAKMAAIQRQMLETDDLEIRLRLQGEARNVLDDTLARVSEKGRPMLEVSIKIVGALMDEAQTYLRDVNAFFSAPDTAFQELKSPAAIDDRQSRLDALRAANENLIKRIEGIDRDIASTLDRAKVSTANKRGFMEGFRNSTGRKMGPLLAIRTLDRKLYEQWTALYSLMRAEWGHWQANDEGELSWDRPEASHKCDEIFAEINRLAELQGKAERTLAERS